MINTSDELVIINDELFPTQFSILLNQLLIKLEAIRGKVPDNYLSFSGPNDIGRNAFQFHVSRICFNEKVLRELYKALYVEPKTKEDLGRVLNISFPSDSHFKSFKAGCGLLYLWLWGNREIILSWRFNQSFLRGSKLDYENLIPNKLWKFIYKDKKFNSETQRLVLMTDWKNLEDVSLQDIWNAIRSGFRAEKTKTNLKRLLKAVLDTDKCQFSEANFRAFETFVAAIHLDKTGHIATLDIEQLTDYHSNYKSYGKDGKQKRYGNDVRNSNYLALKQLATRTQIEKYVKILPKHINRIKRRNKHSQNWWAFLHESDVYPGREHIKIHSLFPDWLSALEYYDAHGRARGGAAATLKTRRSQLRILVDYVFLYIPWYQEVNNHPDILIPYKISDFKRWAFWSNEPLKLARNKPEPPLTAKEYYKLRRSETTLSSFVNECSDFFDYVIAEHSDAESFNDLLIDESFNNPVNKDYDKEGSGKRRPTDKVAFPRKVIPFVLAAFDEFENVNYRIQQSILNGTIDGEKFRSELIKNEGMIIPADWDETFELKIDGKVIPVDIFPSLLSLLELVDSGKKRIFAFNSVFRMLRTAMHIGSRVQNTQWLDITLFDQFNFTTEQYFSNLHITVDKTNPHREVAIPSYIFKTLLREKQFQLEQIPTSPVRIYYEGNDSDGTYPEGIVPLFNNPQTNKPFNDSVYHKNWLKFLSFVEKEYNKFCRSEGRTDDCHQFVYIDSQREGGRKDNPRDPKFIYTKYFDANGTEYETEASEIVYRPVHTPHAMRNTFTVMRRFHVRDAVLMEQQGWSASGMVDHYAQGEYEQDRLERLEAADKAIRKGLTFRELKRQTKLLYGDNAIKPSAQGSAMRDALGTSSDDAIKSQHLISIKIPELGDYAGKDGVDIFRKSQNRADVAVYDDCICPVGGMCPAEVLDIIKEERRCAICPIAMFGLDHIPGLKAKARSLEFESKNKQRVLKNAIHRNVSSQTIESIDDRLTNDRLEISACVFIVNTLEQHAKKDQGQGEYVCRDPDLLRHAFKISLDCEDEIQSFLSRLVDAKAYPQFTSGDFLAKVEIAARRFVHGGVQFGEESFSDIDVVAGHIAAIMRKDKLTFDELSKSEILPQLQGLTNGS
ncbi:hypothetical protein MHM87_05680 [Alteromonas sp. Cnat3-28]|uniref:hypothetical protein n=1 Tax=Alteromonas sp. Cnat3-28 TaxID=2917729 RepID=UPI001EF445E1|nr:hypothetical protein [Alteromonas sp. Cnat3-28]MCG7645079.1 hypothetical protein [Alteromonas sp. Cnat3-28]